MVCFGYLRVSTKLQDIENNKNEILNLANEKNLGQVIWIQEKVSGRKDWRKRILGKEFLKFVDGDVLIMSEYSRIGRDFLQSLEFISECRRKNVIVYSTIGDIPYNNDANSNLILAVTAWRSQVERELISYRTKVGIKAHKDAGSIIGRPKKMKLDKDPNNVNKIKDMIDKGYKLKNIAIEFNVSNATLWKFVKKYNLKI